LDELRLWLVTDRRQTRDRDLVAVVGDCLAAGLGAVQVREKDLSASELAVATICPRMASSTTSSSKIPTRPV